MKKNPLRLTQKVCFSQKANPKQRGFTSILKFKHSAFPLKTQQQKNNFFDLNENNRFGHTSARGGVYWEKQTYNDNRVLIAIPAQINPRKEITLILFLHGNQTLLERDLIARQKVTQQLFNSQANSLLIAPQLARDALDSSPGNFAVENFARSFLTEVAKKISLITRNKITETIIQKAKVVPVAFSGGYLPAAKILEVGNINQRIKGIVLLDALYGEAETFADFMNSRSKQTFLFSCFTEPATEENNKLKVLVSKEGFKVHTQIPTQFKPGQITLVKLNEKVLHRDLLTNAWRKNTLLDLFERF